MLLQLPTPIPLDTPRGPAFAHLVLDYGQEHYVHFVCFLNETGECWVFDNREVQLRPNVTMGVRVKPEPPPPVEPVRPFSPRTNGVTSHAPNHD